MATTRLTLTSDAEHLLDLADGELRRSYRYLLDVGATAVALLIIGIFLAVAVAQLDLPATVSTVIKPTLLLVEFCIVALGIRAAARWLSATSELRVFRDDVEGLRADLVRFRESFGDTTLQRGPLIIGPADASNKATGPILRMDD